MQRIIDIIQLSEQYLRKHHIDKPRFNAEYLLAHVLKKTRLDLYLQYDKPLSRAELDPLRDLLRERKNHKPLQYILGEAEFFSLPFYVDENVMIPRPETEILVEKVLKYVNKFFENRRVTIYDIGTGSGCIAVSLAYNISDCKIYASDIADNILNVAARNAEKNNVESKIIFLKGSYFQPFIENNIEKADIIVSNPPYVSQKDWEMLPEEVKSFEPKVALDGGSDGLQHTRKIVQHAKDCLNRNGFIFLEIGVNQKQNVIELFKSSGGYNILDVLKDYNGIDRVIVGQKAE